jgi:prevent-host-death family protein
MVITIDTYTAKATLSKLLDQVEAGAEVTITRRGKPVARLVSAAPKPDGVVFGLLDGRVSDAELSWNKAGDPDWQSMLDDAERKPLG